MKEEYLKLCKTYDGKPFDFEDENRTVWETIQSHWSMEYDFSLALEKLLAKRQPENGI